MFRHKFILDNWRSISTYENFSEEPAELTYSEVAKILAKIVVQKMNLLDLPSTEKEQILTEVFHYFETGNSRAHQDAPVCINPTFLDVKTKRWNVHYLACPFLAYLPVSSKMTSSTESYHVHNYCLQQLKQILIGYQRNKSKVALFFHIADAVQFCTESNESFHVIDSSTLADVIGLANILHCTRNRLFDNESLLITQSWNWTSLAPCASGYIESALATSLTMIPSLYGLRPIPSLIIGNQSAVYVIGDWNGERFDDVLLTVKWAKAPLYNILLDDSLAVDFFARKLQRLCFYMGDEFPSTSDGCAVKCYTPLTYYHIIRSLDDRVRCKTAGRDSSSRLDRVRPAPPFRLAWRALDASMRNSRVLLMSITTPVPPLFNISEDSCVPETAACRLVLIAAARVPQLWRSLNNPNAPDDFWTDVHCFDNFELKLVTDAEQVQAADVTLSFLLPEDHGLDGSLVAFILDVFKWNQVAFLGSLVDFEARQLNWNAPSVELDHSLRCAVDRGMTVDSCKEFEDHYEISIQIHGQGDFSGTFVVDLFV